MTAESEACLVGFISVSKLFTWKLITERITKKTFNYSQFMFALKSLILECRFIHLII